ncbi:alpha/beta hydrolase [Brachybacterium paraconglomeratum]|uniref:alpha/beta hydrolase n=1 Tax=Brachybacterium paraconglomeratum TaxID=173362 RepID=UPI0031EDDE01
MSTDPILGEGYTTHPIDLGADDEGPLIATLIHREATSTPSQTDPGAIDAATKPPILLMHGWSDYIFHRELMEHLGRRGHDVWGLDLRKHGRSLLPGQTATEVDSLSRYDEEIGAALRIIGRHRPPVLLAHSTGGLTAALWAQRHPRTVSGLALNSPWLEMHLGPVARSLAEAPVKLLAERLRERPLFPSGSSNYARATHRDFGGPYDYDLMLKPPGGHSLPANTLGAIIDGQRRLAAAGPLNIPVLVLHSARSRIGARFVEEMRRADSVLDVRALARAAARLGPEVRLEAIDGARHDVFLSDADARARAVSILDEWLETFGTETPTMSAPQVP